jgi:isoleucyl-tRNA synthetase
MFKPIPAAPNFPEIENRILKFWSEGGHFKKLLAKNRGNKKFSFLDGPITANNPMGVHHAWGRTYKDLFQRYKAMQGFDQRFQNGFDCQGLWVEVEVEKELGFNSKQDIEKFGIANFVEKCKERVMKYSKIQTEQSIRLGQWMDWDNSYYTMTDENNYTIWHFLKKCHDRGWIYQGHDVMPWCTRCGTALSEHEIVTEGYKSLTHPSIYFRLPIAGRSREYLLVWTTTPWTLTSNTGVAVHPELTYCKVKENGDSYYLAKSRLGVLKGKYEILDEVIGEKLVGLAYQGPFDELPAQSGVNHITIPWKEISETEGTGMVHIAPGCGKEDFALSKVFPLSVIAPLNEFGIFLDGFGPLSGTNVADSAETVFNDLTRKGLTYKIEDYTHRYPVCWRCDSELVFRLVDEWFISLAELRYQIIDIAQQVRWIPAFGLERELDWLRNMEDWCISKKRYWGLALPIYKCDCGNFDVIGGKEELHARSVLGWEEFDGHSPHRPWVDAVKIKCEKCGGVGNRILDVGNPWLDAGIVPYSTMSYLSNRKFWEEWFPADFITESFPGQFRNWFYAILAMSTVLENKPPFKTLLGYALVKDEHGEDMHKSSGNVIWFEEAAERMGADVMRWMFTNQNPVQNLNFGYEHGKETTRRLLTLWNVYGFFITYALIDEFNPKTVNYIPVTERSLSDRWIISRLQSLLHFVTERLDDYDPAPTPKEIEGFVDDLSLWYVRRSRRRFWKSEGDKDKTAAYLTLYECLVTLTKIVAPLMPFWSEEIYQNLVRAVDPAAPESVHLCAYPRYDPALHDENLEKEMAVVRHLVYLGHAGRERAKLKVRQPLSLALAKVDTAQEKTAVQNMADLIQDELNIKTVRLVDSLDDLVGYRLKPKFDILGPKYGKEVQTVAQLIINLPPDQVNKFVANGTVSLKKDGGEFKIIQEDVEILKQEKDHTVEGDRQYGLALQTTLTPELVNEGLARELVHRVQRLRKEAGFEVTDRIKLYYKTTERLENAIVAFKNYITQETLAAEIGRLDSEQEHPTDCEINGEPARLFLERIPL